MSSVKIHHDKTPSDQLTEAARAECVVKDSTGRIITLKKPNVLAQFRLVKMLGNTALNSAYMSMISPITYITDIDGEAIALPNSERELDALIQRLDEPGLLAVMEGLQEHFGGNVSTEDQEAALKNS